MTEPIITPQTEALLAEFNRSGVRELHVRTPDFEIYLSKDPASRATIQPRLGKSTTARAPAATASTREAKPASAKPAPAAAAPAPDVPADAIIVRAPNIGTFYGAPKPGAEAYVKVGSTVTVGAELCLIEVMKLFTALRAEVDGRIYAILAADGEMVEAGQPLFAIVRN
jgi:acetyl-CoA carboxylase biotin carboxyl carrier protein